MFQSVGVEKIRLGVGSFIFGFQMRWGLSTQCECRSSLALRFYEADKICWARLTDYRQTFSKAGQKPFSRIYIKRLLVNIYKGIFKPFNFFPNLNFTFLRSKWRQNVPMYRTFLYSMISSNTDDFLHWFIMWLKFQ